MLSSQELSMFNFVYLLLNKGRCPLGFCFKNIGTCVLLFAGTYITYSALKEQEHLIWM